VHYRSVSLQATIAFGLLWLLTISALYFVADELVMLAIVVAAVLTVAWGVILGAQRQFGWVGACVPLGAVAITVSASVSVGSRDDCGECYPGLLFLPALGVLGLLLGVGAAVGAFWRVSKDRRSQQT
jgi:hypothetical protein